MRNKLRFNNVRESIPHVINRVCMDRTLWKEAANQQENKQRLNSECDYSMRACNPHSNCSLKCFVDASWTSSQDRAGVAWNLTKEEKQILQGYASLTTINSSLEAEAEALRMVVMEMRD
ncbi:unnamed protein product [Arabis nemorensis]|uniref:RNase H type-1 domain-containing protein n=1 Tax=Arabis nemorensis TaxID=586526 RepID=A0A565BTL1_9BRAS|nr:unnamed protein product [Arabis nemorensis]